MIAGRFRGRRLRSAPGPGLRPTSDRVREAMFSILGDAPRGARVLDLYAGTGALALEALSRGAKRATCVERDPRALAVLERNVADLGLEGEVEIARTEALDYCRRIIQDGAAFEMVFCDPPYASDLAPIGELVIGSDWWTTVCVVEHAASRSLPALALTGDTRRYGSTALTFFWRR